jgi:hypothetical protein
MPINRCGDIAIWRIGHVDLAIGLFANWQLRPGRQCPNRQITTSPNRSRELPVTPDNVIRIMCPNLACKRVLAVPSHARGKLVRCRGCGINIKIPVAKTKAIPPSAASTDQAA